VGCAHREAMLGGLRPPAGRGLAPDSASSAVQPLDKSFTAECAEGRGENVTAKLKTSLGAIPTLVDGMLKAACCGNE